ncbi:uncharacterized protein EAF01_008482 [Botrytis porri]|uniref:F-box domain-containing protein n=1 Tax=Botrytis porri TaxID=87229 RepID=A0A4Z1K5A5_9HELO|nr:uncharacterized protein EAF01_008482 [Botrytis porri]KAF7899269.1 hypothetical protein EAF01_008482 [Botrytis porri]TGO81095.1 hypothetical protein BPOR_1354g00010 [Botrytis porri]
MHRALFLPEIVATILETERSSPGFLHTCLFVSKIFSEEACRILWYSCGAYCFAEQGTPNIRHLAQIAIQNTERAQYYADFIHVLEFSEEESEEENEGEENWVGDEADHDEARWHKELTSLQFPQLKDFSLHESSNATELNTGEFISHYAQPNIESFTVYQGSRISDALFDKLTQSCPRLKSLHLSKIRASNLSKDGLVRFLNRTDALTALVIQTGVYDSWSYEAFEAIAKLPNLTYIEIPDIQDNWVKSVYQANTSTPLFPKLDVHLSAGISERDLECLAHHVPKLEDLSITLQNMPPSLSILASASNFSHLTNLKVEFGPRNRISGSDLLLLARNCPLLSSLSLGVVDDDAFSPPGPASRPSTTGITDDVIDEVAQALGDSIISLRIIFDRSDLLTWSSILSLAQYCQNLGDLTISCNFDWQEAMSGTFEHTFPALENLDLVFDSILRESQVANYDEAMIQSCAQNMFELAPKLSLIWIDGANEGDDCWKSTVQKIYYDNLSFLEAEED